MDLPTEAEPVKVVEGDCLAVLRDLPDGCVDAVITDPPYPCIDRPYGYWTEAEWFALMDPVVEECRRVLKPSGSAVFVLQPNQERMGRTRSWLWRFMADWSERWGMVQDVWWWNHAALPNSTSIQGGLTRPSLKACVWLGPPDCYRNQNEVLWSESLANAALRASARCGRTAYPSGHRVNEKRISQKAASRGGVTPFNVLPIANTNSTDSAGAHGHGAGTPLDLARWWARYICPPGGLVLDPFGGSGTTGVAALAEHRRCLLVERVPEYVAIARRRTARPVNDLFATA